MTIFMVPRQASYNLLVQLILPTTNSRPRNSASQFTSQRISPRVSDEKSYGIFHLGFSWNSHYLSLACCSPAFPIYRSSTQLMGLFAGKQSLPGLELLTRYQLPLAPFCALPASQSLFAQRKNIRKACGWGSEQITSKAE